MTGDGGEGSLRDHDRTYLPNKAGKVLERVRCKNKYIKAMQQNIARRIEYEKLLISVAAVVTVGALVLTGCPEDTSGGGGAA